MRGQTHSILEKALKIVEDPTAQFPEQYIAVVRRPLLALQSEKQTRLVDRSLDLTYSA